MKHILIFILCVFLLNSCNSSHLEDAIDLAEGIPRKTIDTSIMGVNAFVNDSRFSSARDQFEELRNTLQLKYVRMLVNWNDGVQASPEAQPDFSWSDSVIGEIPEGIDALIIINGLPSWMSDSSNWIDGNPRKTFIERWFKPLVARYSKNPRIVGWQVWNEPNMESNPENAILGFSNPENYVEMWGHGC